MKIIIKDSFAESLLAYTDFIAKNNPINAKRFKDLIIQSIKSLDKMPFRGRQSLYFDDDNIRDLIVLGFTITYRIKKDKIEVFGFTKYQNNPFD